MTSENKPLTAIRGFAALWVVGHHLDTSWDFPVRPRVHAALLMGHVAVDVFFVLSGFILTLVYRDLTGAGCGTFALRRICRIYPLHLCIMAALGLAALCTEWSAPPGGSTHPWKSFGPVLLLVQPYLDIATPWNPPSWSLGVELLCYVLFPLVNAALRPAGRSWLLAAVAVLAAAEAMVLRHYDGGVTGQGAVLRALAGFLLGCALGRLFLRDRVTFARHAAALQAAALAGLAVTVLVGDATSVVLAAAVLITAIASATGAVARRLSASFCVWLGQVSYSIYLLHAPLFGLFGKLTPIRAALAMPSLRFAVGGLFLAVLLALSALTNRLIEQPFRRLPRLLADGIGKLIGVGHG
jgi:peptidoglycan/LPS O-acetylase OafA/YrhL